MSDLTLTESDRVSYLLVSRLLKTCEHPMRFRTDMLLSTQNLKVLRPGEMHRVHSNAAHPEETSQRERPKDRISLLRNTPARKQTLSTQLLSQSLTVQASERTGGRSCGPQLTHRWFCTTGPQNGRTQVLGPWAPSNAQS